MNSGNGRARRDEIEDEIEDKIKRTKVLKEACEKAQDELKKSAFGDIGGRATVVRNCFDWLPSIAWNKNTKAKKILTLAQRSSHCFRYQAIVAPEHLSAEECWASEGPLSTHRSSAT